MSYTVLLKVRFTCDECGAPCEVERPQGLTVEPPSGWREKLYTDGLTKLQICSMCAAKCRCDHHQLSHAIGLSGNLYFNGHCSQCGCKKYEQRRDLIEIHNG